MFKVSDRSAERLSNGLAHAVGTVLLLTGLAGIIGVFGTPQILKLPDAVLDIPVWILMMTFGGANMLVALICLFGRRGGLTLGLVGWLGGPTLLAYRIGLWFIGKHYSIDFPVQPLGLSLGATDVLFCASAVFRIRQPKHV